MHTQKTLRTSLIVLAVMLSVSAVVGGVLIVGGVVVVAIGMTFLGGQSVSTTQANHSLAVSELSYDECTRTVDGTLTGQRNSNVNQPVTVTITATVPGDATVYRATTKAHEQMKDKTKAVKFELTDEQAAAFGHPDAKRTVGIVGQDGQLVLAETEWAK